MALARAKAAAPDTVLNALAKWLGSREAVGVRELPDELLDQLVHAGIDRQAAIKVARMVLAKPMTGRTRHGAPRKFDGMPAARRIAAEEPELRAEFLFASAQRLTEAIADDREQQGLDAEKRYLDMHVAAGRNRRRAARAVDQIGGNGEVLVWRTAGDKRVEAFCKGMAGRLFTAGNPPGGVYPGAAHLRCRCHAEVHGRGPLLHYGVA